MIEGKRVLAWIPARSGSKGVKGKNIKELCHKPLISYTLTAATMCPYVDETIVSTDSEEIARVANRFGGKTPFLRPSSLASDKSKTIDAVLHTLDYLSERQEAYDILCLLQPTSPLRTTEDISQALRTFIEYGCQPLVSVNEAKSHPILMRTIDGKGHLSNLLDQNSTVRRQDLNKVYEVNGSIYINLISEINATTSFNDNLIPFIMPLNHSIDIDSEDDFCLAESLFKEEKNSKNV